MSIDILAEELAKRRAKHHGLCLERLTPDDSDIDFDWDLPLDDGHHQHVDGGKSEPNPPKHVLCPP